LKGAELLNCDFQDAVESAGSGDFLFVDPPYTVKHNLNGFVKYNENIFSWADQVRLRDLLVAADNRGARILMTNADHESVRDLYSKRFRLESTERRSVLAGRAEARGAVTELLVRNW
jgi:DNA adenine methylase